MKHELAAKQRKELLGALQTRFTQNVSKHEGIAWETVAERLAAAPPKKLWSLGEMERTGGEPDVVGCDEKTGEVVFADCAPETPKGRRSLCYDRRALAERKEHKPQGAAVEGAATMGIELLAEDEYLALQERFGFDTKTSSWLRTPSAIRELGGALYGERRYGRVFIGHNGAQSYYAVRGFRGSLRV
ncbi:MAG: DUF4256 domain-containing protein [Planctomycetes bacterium]|nr:DUF4256 domain-containing protein [Planctomycetota bacterium]